MFRPIIAEKRKGEFVQQGEFLKKITTTQNPKLDILKHPKGEERLCHEKRSKGRKVYFNTRSKQPLVEIETSSPMHEPNLETIDTIGSGSKLNY